MDERTDLMSSVLPAYNRSLAFQVCNHVVIACSKWKHAVVEIRLDSSGVPCTSPIVVPESIPDE